jgi:hypothetical protein
VKVIDRRKKEALYNLYGSKDTITGVALSHDGNLLLTNSMD